MGCSVICKYRDGLPLELKVVTLYAVAGLVFTLLIGISFYTSSVIVSNRIKSLEAVIQAHNTESCESHGFKK